MVPVVKDFEESAEDEEEEIEDMGDMMMRLFTLMRQF